MSPAVLQYTNDFHKGRTFYFQNSSNQEAFSSQISQTYVFEIPQQNLRIHFM
jgi:YHS domain-containing protein